MSRTVTKDEVSQAVNSMKPYKTLGPDGYQRTFVKQYWHVVGDDVWKLVKQAFKIGCFDPTISETLIAFIPKVDNQVNLREFRPISLYKIIYKIIQTLYRRHYCPPAE